MHFSLYDRRQTAICVEMTVIFDFEFYRDIF